MSRPGQADGEGSWKVRGWEEPRLGAAWRGAACAWWPHVRRGAGVSWRAGAWRAGSSGAAWRRRMDLRSGGQAAQGEGGARERGR